MPWPSLSYLHQHSRQKHLKLSVQLESVLTDGVSLSETERETVGIESRSVVAGCQQIVELRGCFLTRDGSFLIVCVW